MSLLYACPRSHAHHMLIFHVHLHLQQLLLAVWSCSAWCAASWFWIQNLHCAEGLRPRCLSHSEYGSASVGVILPTYSRWDSCISGTELHCRFPDREWASVCYKESCACERSWSLKSPKSASMGAPLSHRKHCSWSARDASSEVLH